MKAGFYKIIDRQGYILENLANEGLLNKYGDVLEVNSDGTHVSNLGQSVITTYELGFFEYLGATIPKPVQEKRIPKVGEVWSVFRYNGEEVFYNILEVDNAIVKFESFSSYTIPYRQVSRLSIKSFMSACTGYKGIPQYRTFSH